MPTQFETGTIPRMTHVDRLVAVLQGEPAPSLDEVLPDSFEAEWHLAVEARLAKWERDPSGLIEADMLPPTPEAAARVRSVAHFLQAHAVEPPRIAAPDGDGGVSLEWTDGVTSVSVQVNLSGVAEVVAVSDSGDVHRYPLLLACC